MQVNDDGGLDQEDPADIDEMLRQVATALDGLTSDRIIIRTLPTNSLDAISVVAMTSDPVAAAFGLDSDDDLVDLSLELPRSASPAPSPRLTCSSRSQRKGTQYTRGG